MQFYRTGPVFTWQANTLPKTGLHSNKRKVKDMNPAWLTLLLGFLLAVPANGQLSGTEDIRVERKVFYKENDADAYQINISFPKVVYIHPDNYHETNLFIQRIMTEAIADFRLKAKRAQRRKHEQAYSFLDIDYQLHLSDKGLFSFKFVTSTKLAGAEKAQKTYTSFNFDFKNNRVLRLRELFDNSVNIENELGKMLALELPGCRLNTRQILANFCLENGQFVLSPDDVTAEGENCAREIRFPLPSLLNILRRDGPAMALIN